MIKTVRLPTRSDVKVHDTWDLSKLFADDSAWERGLKKLERRVPQHARWQGTLAESARQLADCLRFCSASERLAERLGNYAYLRAAEDQTNSDYQRMLGRSRAVATHLAEATSFVHPEIMAIPAGKLKSYLRDKSLSLYRVMIERILRFRPYTLDADQERLLAMQGEMASTPGNVFRQLHDADLKFGAVEDEQGRSIELTPSNFTQLLQSPNREVRRRAFHQFYAEFGRHENSLAAILNGSIQKDVYYAKARGYANCLESALFPDRVSPAVYDNLIATVRKHLPTVHRFYELRRRKMRLRAIHHYDTYVPILSEIKQRHSWDRAVELIEGALTPLGEEYVQVLTRGLSGRWCDRYPNQGKQSGAFSFGTYDGEPYILMNYRPDVLNDVFTLAHEAGHSMHSYLSVQNQPYEYYHYTIFVAEVASTFNEQLLAKHLIDTSPDERTRAYLINNQIDDIRTTIVRQTMFAEFEKITHALVESGEPLTIKVLKATYRKLLEDYFGPQFALDDELALECLRIPHFYRAFYVYKYATGLSAAIALAERVLRGGAQELDDYLGFLKAGCSDFPLELLRNAGVDLETPQPIERAMRRLSSLVDALEQMLT